MPGSHFIFQELVNNKYIIKTVMISKCRHKEVEIRIIVEDPDLRSRDKV